MKDFDLKRLQSELYKMLLEVDRICKKHDIKYMLFAGTALGAVRHKGFIPWDDDLDIIMLRPDYEKFIAVAQQEFEDGVYHMQREYSEHWMGCFSKIRKNNTAFMEKVVPKDKKQHQGMYIDIFPCDNLAKGKLAAKLQFYSSKIVIAKCLSKKGYLTNSKLKKAFMLVTRLLPFKLFLKTAKRTKDGGSERVHSFFAASSKFEKSVYRREWFEETELVKFEEGEFPVSKHYDKLLTVLYGDYMQIPPPEDRVCKEHAILIDFENSYEKYVGMQEGMKFEEFTKSIR